MTGPLIDAPTLADLLAGVRPPVLLDVRWTLGGPPGAVEFARGHIPTAVYVDLDTELAAPPGPSGRHPLPDPADLQAAMRRWGIHDGDTVVVYDDAGAISAARAWWLLRWAGLRNVHVLDGGLAAWVRRGGALSPGVVTPPSPGDVTVRPGAMPTVDAAGAASTARDGVLLDARAAERYRGEVEPVDPVAGHIPGARSLPTATLIGDDGRLLEPADLRARFADAGVQVDGVPDGGDTRPVAAYCGSGVTAAHLVLALVRAGVDAALYPGSWSAWIRDPARPITTGADPG